MCLRSIARAISLHQVWTSSFDDSLDSFDLIVHSLGLAYRAISRYWVLSPISSPEHEPFQAEDIDPSTRWQWNTPSDFVFLKKADSEEDTVLFSNSTSVSQTALIDDYIVPDPTPLQEVRTLSLFKLFSSLSFLTSTSRVSRFV